MNATAYLDSDSRHTDPAQAPIAPIAAFGSIPSTLNEIGRASIALTVWQRQPPFPIDSNDLAPLSSVRFEAAVNDIAPRLASALARQATQSWHEPVTRDVAELGKLFAEVTQCAQVEVRLEPVSTNACWKFHADCVTCRLITTYIGQGTQWMPAADMTSPIRQLSTGDVGLFKGELWAPERPILHRSPPIAGSGEIRLLLVINPRG